MKDQRFRNQRFTAKVLEKYFNERMKDYDKLDSHFGSIPKPLFINGKFNPDNWNSGQDIRPIMCNYGVCNHMCNTYEASYVTTDPALLVDTESHVMWSGLKIYNDQQYIIINVLKNTMLKYGAEQISCDTYLISWYKNRGKCDILYKNNKPMTMDEYIEMLNILDAVHFFGE